MGGLFSVSLESAPDHRSVYAVVAMLDRTKQTNGQSLVGTGHVPMAFVLASDALQSRLAAERLPRGFFRVPRLRQHSVFRGDL